KVIDDHVRHDFRNLVTYMSTFIRFGPAITGEDTDAVDQQWMLRIMHYLQARGYLSADDVRYLLDHTHDLDEDLLAAYVLRAISNKMDLGDGSELPRPLETLWDGRDELGDAFEEFIATDPRLAEWVLQWNRDLDTAEHYVFEDGEYFDRLNEEMMSFEWHLFTSGDWLNVILNTGERPYETNGEWVVDGYVEWDQRIASLDPNDGDLPNLFYALWSKPDRQRQRAAFGFPAIDDDDLLEYCSWARTLSVQELQEWNDFVESLDPSDARVLIDKLESFRFSNETEPRNSSYDDDPIESRKAYRIINRIRKAITERGEQTRFRGL
ncbi:MAG: hypothetical protein R3358_11180, partial [Woeseiaceae bacterium]|nr:hypothetical protein [Woeseiaceae bacterium]